MPEIAISLATVAEAAQAILTSEAELEQARLRLRAALRAAHTAGASYTLLGQLAGLSRQRVAQLINRG